jgi:hypothetical protein
MTKGRGLNIEPTNIRPMIVESSEGMSANTGCARVRKRPATVVTVTIRVINEKTLRVRVSIAVVTMTITNQASAQYTPSKGIDGRDTNSRRRRGTIMPKIKLDQGILERLSLIIDQVVSPLSTIC